MSQRARQAPHAQGSRTQDLRESYDRLPIEKEELHNRISDLTGERDMAKEQKQIALDQYIEVEKHRRELVDKLFRIREMNGQESNDVHEEQQELDELQKELQESKVLNHELKGEKTELERQLRLRERQLEISNQDKAELQRKTDHMTDLEQQLRELQAKECGYKREIEGLNQRLTTLATNEKRQEERIQPLKQSLDQVCGEKDRCEDQLRNHDKTKASAEAGDRHMLVNSGPSSAKDIVPEQDWTSRANDDGRVIANQIPHKPFRTYFDALNKGREEARHLTKDYNLCRMQEKSIKRDLPYLRDQIQVLKGDVKPQSSRGSNGKERCEKLKDALDELERTTWLSGEGTSDWCFSAQAAMSRMADMDLRLKRYIDNEEDRAEDVEKVLQEWTTVISDATREVQSVGRELKVAGEQRKDLCERILDAKGSIRVFCRIRPRAGDNIPKNPIAVQDQSWLEISTSFESSRRGVVTETKSYRFNRIFGPDAAQVDFLNDVLPLCQTLLNGETSCVLCYGPTNSGKTYTMLGPQAQCQGGLISAVLQKVSLDMEALPHPHRLELQPVELYNGGKAEYGPNQEVSNLETAETWVAEASRKRQTRATKNNRHSSRSHWGLILKLTSTTPDGKRSSNEEKAGKMLLLDLAGTEPCNANADATSGWESRKINSDLFGLRTAIHALAKREKPNFREFEVGVSFFLHLRSSLGTDWCQRQLLKFLKSWLDRQGVRILSLVHVDENTELQSIQTTMEFSELVCFPIALFPLL
ncbi:MAG: hypothetical protein Q9220_007053 [cf. Caloplaca sp. 1 TL-2023]